MVLLEDCQGAENIKLTYTPWRAGGMNFIFSPEEEEEGNTENQEEITYFVFIAILEDGREQLITERNHQNVRTEQVEPYLDDPVELEFTAPKGRYNFYLDENATGYVLRRQHVQFNLGNNLAFISSDVGLPRPEYSYVCDLEECPEGTWALECGDTICCYKADGYAVKSFKKPEEV